MHKYTRKNLPHYQARKLKFLSVIVQDWGAIRFSCIFGGFHKFFSGFLCKIPKYYCSKLSAIRFSCKFGGFHNFFSGITAQNWGAIRFSCIFGGFQKNFSGFCVKFLSIIARNWGAITFGRLLSFFFLVLCVKSLSITAQNWAAL